MPRERLFSRYERIAVSTRIENAITTGDHNIKVGGSISATRLTDEHFTLGFTDPTFNDLASPDFNPNLLPFDLTRGGSPFVYDQAATIRQQAAYVQDEVKFGAATVKAGLRLDHYDGLTAATLLQPRLGLSYAIAASGTTRTSSCPVRSVPRRSPARPCPLRRASGTRSKSARSRVWDGGSSWMSAISTRWPINSRRRVRP